MRKPLYFDGAPDRFSRTKALFTDASRLQVRYPPTAAPQPPTRRTRRRPDGGLSLAMVSPATANAWLMKIVWGS